MLVFSFLCRVLFSFICFVERRCLTFFDFLRKCFSPDSISGSATHVIFRVVFIEPFNPKYFFVSLIIIFLGITE